ncbi:MAG TPA: ABC transporter substrate-binding protein [Methylomirabilota bacterium]|nr:ABC transporter substrate-binding protein [Methylomirabilota bacterium]
MTPTVRAGAGLSLALLLVTPALGRAQEAPRRGGEIRVATYGDPGTLDPHITTDVPALRIRNQICETLITWDAQTKESPMLADSWENSADGTVWTFKLRRGVKFHGGQIMRAVDVKYSFERILKVSPRKTDYHMIKEIRTPDDHTVQFVLSARTSAFFPALAMYWAQVVEATSTEKQVKETGGVTTPNCTGPFKVSEYRRGQWIKLVRHEAYVPRPEKPSGMAGARVAYADGITYSFIPDANVRLLSLQQGEVQYIERVLPEQVEQLKKMPGVEVVAIPGTQWSAIYFNFTKGWGQKKEFRQAVAMALNYEELNRAVFYGTGRPNNSMIPESQAVWRTKEHARMHPYDVEKAKALLKQIGYNGEPIDMPIPKETVSDLFGQSMQAQLAKAGINLKITYMEQAAQLDLVYSRRRNQQPPWDIAFLGGSAFRPDPDQHYYTRAHTSAHVGMYSNPAYDKLVEEARKESSFEKRKALYAQAQTMIMDDVPMIVIGNLPYIEAYSKKLRGVEIRDPHFDYFWNVWLAR